MSKYNVKVKWGKETFSNVELNMEEAPIVFKAQLFALTGVNPERQKVMLKGAILKDEEWGNWKLKDNITILLMGTRDELPPAPTNKTLFMEDMTESELATAMDLPAGLNNLGNTCYMNATVQCLKAVPELRQALRSFEGSYITSGNTASNHALAAGIRELFEAMDKGGSVPPLVVLQLLHIAFPRFAEKTEHGSFMQQDANECWTELVRVLQQKLKALHNRSDDSISNFIDEYFGGVFDVTYKNSECEEEQATYSKENFLQLSCFINQDVKYLHSGLKSRVQETLTKLSPTLNKDCLYQKTMKISRLPAYLTVQFVRFYYKEKESINAKILKDVKFPMVLDMYDLCSEDLQKKLLPLRTKFKDIEDKLVSAHEKKKDLKEKTDAKYLPFSFEDDPGSNNSGYYELSAVLTHRGRSSSSGHYVAWIRQKHTEEWFKCDDDDVSIVTSEDILKLSGGGDWHCAYVLLYGPRLLEETPAIE